MTVTVAAIAAMSKNFAIGKDNKLLWHIPDDFRHFKETTMGKPVIMGRKTYDSLPDRFRPLPGRFNIVVGPVPEARIEESLPTLVIGNCNAWLMDLGPFVHGCPPAVWQIAQQGKRLL